MATAIMLGRHLQIEVVGLAIDIAIFDAGIGEMDLIIEVRQVVLAGPFFDFFSAPVRAAVATSITVIALLQEALVVAFQLSIEFHANNGCSAVLEFCGLAQIGTIDLHVMGSFSRLVGARIEGLPLVSAGITVAFQEAATAIGERGRSFQVVDQYAFDESLLFEMSDVTARAVEIPLRNDAKRTDCCQTSCFRSVQSVVPTTIVYQFSFRFQWQVQIAGEGVSWIVGTAIGLSLARLPIPFLAPTTVTVARVVLDGVIGDLFAVGSSANDEPLFLAILDAVVPLACVVVARIETTRHRSSSAATSR